MSKLIPPDSSQSAVTKESFLGGQMLIAMPSMADPRFMRSLVYICAHSTEGAMGLVLNQCAQKVKLPELLVQLNVIIPEEMIRLPSQIRNFQILRGGPVEAQRGFVLHSTDYALDQSTMQIDKEIALTGTIDILRAIAKGQGPHQAMLALGYVGWSAGQLEDEISKNGWLTSPVDSEFVFDPEVSGKYMKALHRLGIDIATLSREAGHS